MRALVCLAFVVAASTPAQERTSALVDGTILSEAPCPFTSYEETSAFTQRHYSREEYEAARTSTTVECVRVRYISEGLAVVGFVVRPSAHHRRYPAIIYNRGGYHEIGKIDSSHILDFYGFASEGFVVLASQYRGNDGGEGQDEVGGADVADVLALSRLATSLPYIDSSNLFLYGLSRGGMMAFLALRRGFPANAVAVVGAVFDLEAFQQRAPKVVASALAFSPEYRTRGVMLLRERSAMNWPDRVSAPLLIIHGSNDQEVPATEAMAFATKLAGLGKRYQLIVYADDVHEVAKNRRDRDTRIATWFQQHMRP